MIGRAGRYWEGLCRHCGVCCCMKIIDGDQVYVQMDAPCRDYDVSACTCRIYETRFTDNSDCRKMTLAKAMFASYLHDQCGYVQWARRHHIRFARKKQIIFSGK